jgi:hypothetical protein
MQLFTPDPFTFPDPGTTNPNEYRIELNQQTGIWSFYFAGSQIDFPTYPTNSTNYWLSYYGVEAKWCGEIHDLGSHFPGIVPVPLSMQTCMFCLAGGSYVNAGSNVSGSGFNVFNPTSSPNGRTTILSSSSIQIWDNRP